MGEVDILSDENHKLNRDFMMILGLWPEFPRPRRLLLQFIAFMALFPIIIPQWAYLIRVCDSVDDLITAILEHLVVAIGLVKFFFFAISLEGIGIMVNDVRENWRILEKLSAIETLRTYAKRGHLGTKFYIVIIYTTVVVFNLFPLEPVIMDAIIPLNESRSKLFALKTDHSIYGIDANEQYLFVVIHDFWAAMVVMTYVITVDTFIVVVVEHCCGLLVSVGDILQRIRTDLPTEQQYKIICDAVVIHHRAITLAHSVESSFTIMYGFAVAISMVLISTTGVACILTLDEPANAARFAFFGGGQLFHLLYMSLPGQELYDHSSRVLEEIYNCEWSGISLETKKLISIMLVGSVKPMYLTAGGFYILNVENFGAVLKTSFSFFTVMLSSR